jgi:hypothetical protein
MTRQLAIILVAAAALPACRPRSAPGKTEARASSTTKPDRGEAGYGPEVGHAIYEDLVMAVRRYHVFSDRTWENLGFKWEDELPRLEEEFSSIRDRADLLRALNHFANSLHNPHCHYGSPDPPSFLTPGFEIEVEWIQDEPRFYVAGIRDPELEGRIQPGDTLVT